MSITGHPDGEPGGGPVKCGVAFADLFTGLYAVAGVLAALAHRERTGEGQYVDVALLDTQVAVLANQALNYLVSGKAPPRLGNAHPNIVPYQSFATQDGHVIITVGTDRQFREFCRIAGLQELAEDARFASNRARVQNRGELIALIAEAMRKRTTQEWVEALETAAIPCGPINSIDQVFADPQVRHRGMQIELRRTDGVRTPGVANPVRLSKTPIVYERPAPLLGADTEEVLTTLLGLDEAKIAALRKAGVVG
jgi:crotonobetainyl-CoA:carnitine CoA-transferase CaiB-like acyl-CoA transferase